MGNTASPSSQPSYHPSFIPTSSPSISHTPTYKPSFLPSSQPSLKPSFLPSCFPTSSPSYSFAPTQFPSYKPTYSPTTSIPTNIIGITHRSAMNIELMLVIASVFAYCVVLIIIIVLAIRHIFVYDSNRKQELYQELPYNIPESQADPSDNCIFDIEMMANHENDLLLANKKIREMESNNNQLINQLNATLKEQEENMKQSIENENNLMNDSASIQSTHQSTHQQLDKAIMIAKAIDIRSLITRESKKDVNFDQYLSSCKKACNTIVHFHDDHREQIRSFPSLAIQTIENAWPKYQDYCKNNNVNYTVYN